MHSLLSRKNKITLSDYNFSRDIQVRLHLSKMSVDAVGVLQEILDSSLQTSIVHLAEVLEMSLAQLTSFLDELSELKLFRRQGDMIFVDKEMRKYLELQVVKFNPDYEMGMEFLQNLLSQVPAHAIPNWYALSRTTDSLFSSIVEKFLMSPPVYQRYLDELVIDYPNAMDIAADVMKAPEFMLTAAEVMDRYGLSHEAFEESVLHLEFNFVCCLRYRRVGNRYEEVITPFHEWREYLIFLQKTMPTPIEAQELVVRDHSEDFGFLKTMAEDLRRKRVSSDKVRTQMKLLGLVDGSSEELSVSAQGESWLQLPLQEQAAALYRHTLLAPCICEAFTDKDLRQVQKSLKRVTKLGWVYFDDFVTGFARAIGSGEPTKLSKKGKRWRYCRPVVDKEEELFIAYAIFEVFFQAGMVATGTHQGRRCFCVTPFGRFIVEG